LNGITKKNYFIPLENVKDVEYL
jgi:hypothetical protein